MRWSGPAKEADIRHDLPGLWGVHSDERERINSDHYTLAGRHRLLVGARTPSLLPLTASMTAIAEDTSPSTTSAQAHGTARQKRSGIVLEERLLGLCLSLWSGMIMSKC
jgi:hypothetical protein